MATYDFQTVLVWDTNPGGVVRLLRNGSVTVYNAATDATLFSLTSDSQGLVSFTTTDVPTVYLKTTGWTSGHITAASAIEAAAAFTVSEDAAVANLVNDPGSSTRAGLNSTIAAAVAPKVDKDRQVVWLEDQAGVAVDGTTECGTAIQSAINSAEALGVTLVSKPGRVYVTASTLTFKKSCDLWDSTISYSGTGTAVVLGDPVNGVTRQHFRIGRVVSTAFTTGWATAGAIGVQIVDVNKSRFDIKSVYRFLAGIQALGHARGCSYNEIHVGELSTNKVNMQMTADSAAGWCNQTQVYGGSWNHDPTDAGGSSLVTGTKHVLQDASNGGPVPDTNLFSGCAFEGNVVEFIVDSAGKMNTFRDCRWEASAPAVRWNTGSYGNAIRDGYKPDLITVTNSGDLDNVVTWPKSGDISRIVILPKDMTAVSGTPATAVLVRHVVMNMALNDIVAFSTVLPINWHTFDVELRVTHDTAGAGTTSWTFRPAFDGPGDTLANPAGSASGSVTMPTQKGVAVATIVTGLTATPGDTLTANLFIGGGTFANTAGVLAVVLKRRS